MSSDPEQKAGDVLSLHDGKMVKTIITPGIGQRSPPAGSKVFVHYVGTLQATGEKFDSSRDRGDPFSFTIGSGQVIKGWDVGVGYMRKNEKSMLTLHSDFAYGDRGSPPKIPGGATLCFEVELLDWEKDASPVTEDKGVMKTTAQESAEPMSSRPQRYATCTFSMEVRENDEDGKTVQKEQEYVLDLDDTATATSSIAGLWGVQEAVRSMKKGEIAEFTVEPDYGTGQDGALAEKLGLPLGGRLRLYLKITLQSYTDVEGFPKEHHEWATQSTAFKLAHAQRLKATGNFFYAKQKQFGRALAYYKEALDLYFDEEESSGN
jgi:FK506-binding protein 4/5